MSLTTSNKFGKISISEEAMQTVASHTAQEILPNLFEVVSDIS